ncbi:hypothetical protein ACET3X_004870 [Alternaria dauci]|uniref:Uncharacterized protein n=1 Tax=Alternaria dauci TaxID=48095 RepID=A0ABR3UIY7_9PLEO
MNTFLTVPVTIREQVYHELLTYLPPATNVQVITPWKAAFEGVAPSSPICKLLTLNRQVNTEVFEFLTRQLCVVVKTNQPRFIGSIFDERVERLPLISQLQSCTGAIKKDISRFPVAMEWDICALRSELEPESAPCYLMPATSMIQLIQIARHRTYWQMDKSLAFTILDTFSFSKDRALEILVSPWLKDPPFRHKFLGIITNDVIPPLMTADLRKRLQEQYSAAYYLTTIDMFRQHASNDDPENAVRKYKMACKYARLVYDCHLDKMRNNFGDLHRPWIEDRVLMLWMLTCETATELIQSLLRLGLADASDGVTFFREARKVAEEMINLLSSKPLFAREESVASEAVQKQVRKTKFLLSFKAHKVCKALGDVDAAISHLEDAIKYDCDNPENPVERLRELKAERGTGDE